MDTKKVKELKAVLYAFCQQYVESRILNAKSAMEAAQASANEESKSTAGDKYETGRAMAQLERDKHAVQLAESLKLEKALKEIQPDSEGTKVFPGSLVFTNIGNLYISISAGKLAVKGKEFFAVSPTAPLAKVLLGKSAGDTVIFNSKEIFLEAVF